MGEKLLRSTPETPAEHVQFHLASKDVGERLNMGKIAAEISNSGFYLTYGTLRHIVINMKCITHDGRGQKSCPTKWYEPRDEQDIFPSTCQNCHFGKSGTEGCIILFEHQKNRVLRGGE